MREKMLQSAGQLQVPSASSSFGVAVLSKAYLWYFQWSHHLRLDKAPNGPEDRYQHMTDLDSHVSVPS